MNIEDELVRHRPDLLLAGAGNPRFVHGDGESGRQGDEDGGRGGDMAAMTPDEFGRTVAHGLRPRVHRFMVQIPAQVLRELRGPLVPPLRIDVERAHQDVIQVAFELACDRLVCGGVARPCNLGPVRLYDRDGRQRGEAARTRAGEELVEHGAQGVDVRKRRHGVTANLLRAGVVGRHRGADRIVGRSRVGSKQLADAEVEQLGDAIRIDEDVAGFQVAVNDEIAMSVIDSRTDVDEHPEPVVNGQSAIGGKDRQPRTIDVLHDEIGQAVVGGAPVEQTADVRMLQARERLTLATEAREDELGVHARSYQLDGDLHVILIVVPLGEEDGAHTATPELPDQPVRTDANRLRAGDGGVIERCERLLDPMLKKTAARVVTRQQ